MGSTVGFPHGCKAEVHGLQVKGCPIPPRLGTCRPQDKHWKLIDRLSRRGAFAPSLSYISKADFASLPWLSSRWLASAAIR